MSVGPVLAGLVPLVGAPALDETDRPAGTPTVVQFVRGAGVYPMMSTDLTKMLREAKALSLMLSCTTQGTSCDEALPLVRTLWEASHPASPAEWLRHSAMASVLGETVQVPALAAENDAAGQLFLRTSLAWTLWAAGRLGDARLALKAGCEPTNREGAEIHLMALGPWCRGVGALLDGDHAEALRFFRRATEIGSQLGTETNEAIQWSYAATLFQSSPHVKITS